MPEPNWTITVPANINSFEFMAVSQTSGKISCPTNPTVDKRICDAKDGSRTPFPLTYKWLLSRYFIVRWLVLG